MSTFAWANWENPQKIKKQPGQPVSWRNINRLRVEQETKKNILSIGTWG
jgi:hypothetical protein